jgi:hypothetical protein
MEMELEQRHHDEIQKALERKGRFWLHHKNVNGKYRPIYIPDKETKNHNYELISYLDRLDIKWPESVYGSLPERGFFLNAEMHVDSKFIFSVDLKDAFANVHIPTLFEIFSKHVPEDRMQYVEDKIFHYCTTDTVRGLPQGAPASPRLFDIYYRPLDLNIHRFLNRLRKKDGIDITYTRYLDDLTFSCKEDVLSDEITKKLRRIIEAHPCAIINHKKTKKHSLERKETATTVTGISIYSDGRVGLSPKIKERANSICDIIPAVLDGEIAPVSLTENHHNRLREKVRERFLRGSKGQADLPALRGGNGRALPPQVARGKNCRSLQRSSRTFAAIK